jgi:DNA-binding response OmpR family regulator
MKILAIEADELTAHNLVAALLSQYYTVEVAPDGETGWEFVQAFAYDLVLVDVRLPQLDGISLCQRMRSGGYTMPILLLTERDNRRDRLRGLDAGADDTYPLEPFDAEDLLARVRALLRRPVVTALPVLEWRDLRLDPSTCEVTYLGQPLSLTPKEYALLELFLRNTHRVFSCAAILDRLWAFQDVPGEYAVRTHIKDLRQKLKGVGAPADTIETVYGMGYRLKQKEIPISTQVLHRGNPPDARVMVVDDDPKILEILRTLLEPWGLKVTTLDDPRRFWETLTAVAPDLLVVDLKMPHISGVELCQIVRNDAHWGGLPIVCLTDQMDTMLIERVFAVGADDFASKPIVGPELVARILNRLERFRLWQRLAHRDGKDGRSDTG